MHNNGHANVWRWISGLLAGVLVTTATGYMSAYVAFFHDAPPRGEVRTMLDDRLAAERELQSERLNTIHNKLAQIASDVHALNAKLAPPPRAP